MNPQILVRFSSLQIGDWFIFPAQMKRLVSEDVQLSQRDLDEGVELAINVKVGVDWITWLHDIQRQTGYPSDVTGEKDPLVLRVKKPGFVPVG